jgi:hypothetical protein
MLQLVSETELIMGPALRLITDHLKAVEHDINAGQEEM